MIPQQLVGVLGNALIRHVKSEKVHIYRHTLTSDNRGGQIDTWRKIATVDARLQNKRNTETIIGDALQPQCFWVLVADRNTDILCYDRIRADSMKDSYFEVTATDFGQSQLIVQHVDLVQYSEDKW